MQALLMHKRLPVLELELDDATGTIRKTGRLYSMDHLPLGIPVKNGAVNKMALNAWWMDRGIPMSRAGLEQALLKLHLISPGPLLLRSFGLSVSDHYWISPKDQGLSWEQVNFFEHSFPEDLGNVLFGAGETGLIDVCSPDAATDGNLKKKWIRRDGKLYLVKGGSGEYCQQPFNEVIASGLMECMGIPHVPYEITWEFGEPCSVCENLTDESIELIPAWQVYQTQKRANHTSVYQHFLNCCDRLGIEGVVPFLDQMMALDDIIADEDRHFHNFGILRHSETLEWLGMAPIYDSGTSLGYDKTAEQIRSEQGVPCKPFKNHHAEQVKLISNLDWLPFDQLGDASQWIEAVLTANGADPYIKKDRLEAIRSSVMHRIVKLKQLSQTVRAKREETIHDDVQSDIAENYQE